MKQTEQLNNQCMTRLRNDDSQTKSVTSLSSNVQHYESESINVKIGYQYIF